MTLDASIADATVAMPAYLIEVMDTFAVKSNKRSLAQLGIDPGTIEADRALYIARGGLIAAMMVKLNMIDMETLIVATATAARMDLAEFREATRPKGADDA